RGWWREGAPTCRQKESTFPKTRSIQEHSCVSLAKCVENFRFLESVHSSFQINMNVVGFVWGCYVMSVYFEGEDKFALFGGKNSISYSAQPSHRHISLTPIFLSA
uniref:Sodium/potassium-transporting ATPase subunit beta-1-interacting protein n=1 Tax=Callorhinchus milii TaxID=7868 RepID=A0A4W3K3V5_CALMI